MYSKILKKQLLKKITTFVQQAIKLDANTNTWGEKYIP